MKKKVIASILAASMAAMALTGCGGGKTTSEAQGATTDETTASTEAGSTADGAEAPDLNQDTKGTTITFWHSMGGVNGEAMDYLVNKFNEENTDGITAETVCALSKLDVYQKITVDLKMDELDVTAAENKATYEEIREYVKEHTGLNVSNLYIAQVKRKCGIKERQNYNKPKAENPKQLKCPPEKEKAIREALKYFKMI